MSGNTYQLKTKAPVGAFVVFNGVYDKYGKVMAHRESGYHLIQGFGLTMPPEAKTFYPAEVESR